MGVPQVEPLLGTHVQEALTRLAGMGSLKVAVAVVVVEVLMTSTVKVKVSPGFGVVLLVTLEMVIGAGCSTCVVSVSEQAGSVDPGTQLVFGASTFAVLVIDVPANGYAIVPLTVIVNVLLGAT
jgi:hypothetical protein